MSIVSKPVESSLISAAPAANADQLGEQALAGPATEGTGGWDAYDVWRRFIKEARERRQSQPDRTPN